MTSLNIDTGSMASSTPIRIGSFHGSTSISNNMQPTGASGSGSVSGGGGGGGGSVGVGSNDSPLLTPATGQLQQSSSVPSSTTSSGHLQLQSQSSLTLGTSNQSLGTSITPPNSAGLKQTSGLASWATDTRDKYDGSPYEKTPSETSKLNRKESYKAQRKNYRLEKKRVASELFNSLQDPAVIVLADWLKVRGTLKSWTKLWCVLKPGLLLLYKSPKTKSSHWVGTILLTSCQVIERPSKKDGFCFKLFHPMDQSIWAPRGPDKETIGAVVQPLPTAYLIFRAPSQAAGKCWMDALELSLRCSALLLRSSNNTTLIPETNLNDNAQITSHETQWSEADYEKHFNEHDTTLGAFLRSFSPQHGNSNRRFSNFLTVPDIDGNKSNNNSDASRSQTPLLQHLYMTMSNWERYVANKPEFQKIKNFRKLHKLKRTKKNSFDGVSSTGDFSDVSSVDFSPKTEFKKILPHQSSLQDDKISLRRRSDLTKSSSLDSHAHQMNQTSSSDDNDNNYKHHRLPISNKLFVMNVEGLNYELIIFYPICFDFINILVG